MNVKWVFFVTAAFLIAVALLAARYESQSTHFLIDLDAQHNSFAIRG